MNLRGGNASNSHEKEEIMHFAGKTRFELDTVLWLAGDGASEHAGASLRCAG